MSVSAISTSSATGAQSRPAGGRRGGPTISVRKYGHNDFERFDEETARGTHLCVGSGSVGKVDVDVKYRWKQSQWGVLGDDKSPAGIVYLDLTFKQPHGYWLKSARVFVTLSEDSSTYALGKARRRDRVSARIRNSINPDYDLQLTEHYGPQFLTGTRTVQNVTKLNSLVPSIGAMGMFEVGGMGQASVKAQQRECRWVFKGTVRKPRDSDSLRTLEWELSENELDPAQPHKQDYQTAFAFEHNYRPVFMRVEVEGKLRSKSQNAKHKVAHNLLRFSSNPNKKDYSTLTHIDLREGKSFQKNLDPIATSLSRAMEMKNMLDPPLEVPGPTPAHFFQAGPDQSISTGKHQQQGHHTAPALQHDGSQASAAPELAGKTPHPQHQSLTESANYNLGPEDIGNRSDLAEVVLLRTLRRHQTARRNRPDLAAHVRLEEMRDNDDNDSTPEDSDADVQTSVGSSTLVNSQRSSFSTEQQQQHQKQQKEQEQLEQQLPKTNKQDPTEPTLSDILNSTTTPSALRYLVKFVLWFQRTAAAKTPKPPPKLEPQKGASDSPNKESESTPKGVGGQFTEQYEEPLKQRDPSIPPELAMPLFLIAWFALQLIGNSHLITGISAALMMVVGLWAVYISFGARRRLQPLFTKSV
ncbi:hypothetical protein QBC42DRAFT_314040 [Cladorrhinum samala]|uniref:Uncharacterized protein n=1 Tax=Cladorrhinum samala TaxID=585594 RepID=A0AAV9HGB2_9PEZI|nr:hypothetical protein QBC42DRAFT_314040 [Cladorrhinum samala]